MDVVDPTGYNHGSDLLRNVSVFRERCMCCGKVVYDSITEDRADGWMVCPCGHVLHAENRVRWS